MARRFVRVDLSDVARDFRPVAIEPGLPVLDEAGANGRLLFKWLGGLVAEPEWAGESVSFFVQDDHGGRLEEVVGQPASDEDLQGLLKEDLALLRERLAKAKAESPSERLVLKRIREEFAALADDPNRFDRDSHLFRYRDQQHRWRLVWCPGYQRSSSEAAPAVICTDPDCNLLFVRRPGGSARCPGCRATLLAKAAPKGKGRWVALLILLLLAALAAWWLLHRPGLSVTPDRLELAVGDSADLKIETRSDAPIQVTSSNPAIVEVGPGHRLAARSAGQTDVEVRQGSAAKLVGVVVTPAATPPEAGKKEEEKEKEEKKGTPSIAAVPPDTRGKPSEVAILSDQGPAVRVPVGADFGDFRVEARYPDGFTRIVTRSAALRTPEDAAAAPVSFSGGKMHGVRPGKTVVQAEFAGVAAKQGLEVEVTSTADIDEIRLTPSPANILPGETIALEATGYQKGKSVGSLSGLGGLTWKTSDDGVLRVAGPAATGLRPGQASVTAQLGSVASRPAQVTVAESIAEALKVEPSLMRVRVGEGLRIGSDVSVTRGNVDLGPQVTVTPTAPNVVRYDPATHSLIGVAPGVSAVRFGRGDKIASAFVEVVDAALADGQVVIEPAAGVLSPGQALGLRAYLVGGDGLRVDRTSAATFTSASPEKVQISGDWACALAPGTAGITATLPEAKAPGKASIAVDDNPITELIVKPSQIAMGVGDRARLTVLGRSASGVRELFPQAQLRMTVGGTSPAAIRIVGSQHVDGVRSGSATVHVAWADKFKREALVTVSDAAWSGLSIDPGAATVHPGQQLGVTVTGVRGGQRRVVLPEDGLRLSVADPAVAQVAADGVVRALNPGRTRVTAQVGDARAEAALEVAPGSGPTGVVIDTPGPGLTVTNPDGTTYLVGPGGVVYPRWDGTWYAGPGVVPGGVVVGPREVTVIPPTDRLWLEPPRSAVGVGGTTPRFAVMAQSSGAAPREVAATLDSMNPAILAPATDQPGRFLASQMGSTQVRATVGDRTLYADVNVSGARFDTVRTSIASPSDHDFAVRAEITAAGSNGALEYRVYRTGQPGSEAWVPAQIEGDHRRVVLESPRIPTGPSSAFYSLTFEARDPATGTVQQYPFTFRLAPTIERAEGSGK